MTLEQLKNNIKEKQNFLCVGLDTDIEKLPNHLPKTIESALIFNKNIINATKDLCVAYKINTAFYECLGADGWSLMKETIEAIPPSHFIIADAKRGDIGNTSNYYAKTFFETLNTNAITVAPYMGKDSVQSFLNYEDKFTILLALTSNEGANDFELQKNELGEYIFESVIKKALTWNTNNNLMFVVGATKTEYLKKIRAIAPDSFLLIPGVGFQGGSLADVYMNGKNTDIGLLVNVSRSIIYASENEDYEIEAKSIAEQYAIEMKILMQNNHS